MSDRPTRDAKSKFSYEAAYIEAKSRFPFRASEEGERQQEGLRAIWIAGARWKHEELVEEMKRLRAELWIANDRSLRTYDGTVTISRKSLFEAFDAEFPEVHRPWYDAFEARLFAHAADADKGEK